MKRLFNLFAKRVAPRTMHNLSALSELELTSGGLLERVMELEVEVRRLRNELNETRRDNRRTAELYNLVFERLKDENPL